jgi:hypothetical protein
VSICTSVRVLASNINKGVRKHNLTVSVKILQNVKVVPRINSKSMNEVIITVKYKVGPLPVLTQWDVLHPWH